VVDLAQINLATEEDKLHQIDKRAALLKAASWEEIKMFEQENDFLEEKSKSHCQLSQEEEILSKNKAQEEHYSLQYCQQHELDELGMAITEQDSAIATQNCTMAKQNSTIAKQNYTIDKQVSTIATQHATIAELNSIITERDSTIAALKERLAALEEKS